jgi:hypothetical protein
MSLILSASQWMSSIGNVASGYQPRSRSIPAAYERSNVKVFLYMVIERMTHANVFQNDDESWLEMEIQGGTVRR